MRRTFLLSMALLLCPAAVYAQALNLFDVYAQALDADPRLKIAQQQVALGQARADSSFGALLPQANFSANFSDNEVSFDNDILEDQDYNGKRYGFTVRQMLFNWKTISNRRRTKQVVAQKEAELLDVMGILLVDTSERYFNVLLADGKVRLIQAERELVQQQLRQTEEMYERKLVRVTDFLETQARADMVLTDEIEAENEAALARESLSELTGTYVGSIAPLRSEFELPELEKDMDYWVNLATESNALLHSKHEAVLAAKAGVQEQKGGHYPTVDLVLSSQTSDIGYDNQQSPERETDYIGVDITIPIYSGGSTSARVREAWASYYIAREEEEAARREVLKRTREAWLNTRSSRKRIHASQLSVRSATKSFEAMSKSFTYGTVTAADVLEALHSRTRAERDYQNALFEYITNWLALKRESGILEDTDLQQVNSWLLVSAA